MAVKKRGARYQIAVDLGRGARGERRRYWATFATELLLAGVHPKIVSEALGHASVRMTLDRYSHAVPHLQDEAAALLDLRLRALLGEDVAAS